MRSAWENIGTLEENVRWQFMVLRNEELCDMWAYMSPGVVWVVKCGSLRCVGYLARRHVTRQRETTSYTGHLVLLGL